MLCLKIFMTLYVVSRKRVKMVFYLYEEQKDRYATARTTVGEFQSDNAFEDLTIWLDGFLYKKYSPDFDKTMELINANPNLSDKLKIHMMNLTLKDFELFITDESLTEGN